jgi:hypothetical protein
MAVKARVRCIQITDMGLQKDVLLRPVMTHEDDDPNKSFSKYTPAGELKLSITNPEAFEQFAVGATYDVDFSLHKPITT